VDVNLSLSPDEHQVALALRSGSPENLDIWTIDIAPNRRNRVTTEAQPEGWPVWSPDGTRIVFGRGPRGIGGVPEKARLVQTLINGAGPNETLVEAVGTPSRPCGPRQCFLTPSDWSADGRYVLYTFSGTFPRTQDIWALPLVGDRTPIPVAQTEFAESLGTFSPNGRWIAYTSDEPGQPNVYVQPFLRAGRKYRISPNGGRNPHWRADGKELFYLAADGAMTAVTGRCGPGVSRDVEACVKGSPYDQCRADSESQRARPTLGGREAVDNQPTGRTNQNQPNG